MQLLDRFHLTYCTNIHPGRDWAETFENLERYVPPVKAELCPDQPFGLGLRLSALAASELMEGDRLEGFRRWLDSEGIYVFTINGFPYGNFHGESVKDKVHEPDWTREERVEYTRNLIRILAKLLPGGVSGGISTSPLSYRHWHANAESRESVREASSLNLIRLARELGELEEETGIFIHLDIEPEPDGMLENSAETIDYFTGDLFTRARRMDAATERWVRRHINLCYDVCHFALAYEEPAEAFRRLKAAGVRIGKIQLSAALALRDEDLSGGTDPWKTMETLNEPTYLHQVTQKQDGTVRTFRDIPELLDSKPGFSELRSHFHVPVFSDSLPPFRSTHGEIRKVLEYIRSQPDCDQLEVETYTWEVLPEELKISLVDSIVREIEWCRDRLMEY